MSCVDAAITFANDPSHEGHGYTIKVELDTGTVLEGVIDGLHQSPHVLRLTVLDDANGDHDVFIDKSRIVSAAVVW